MSKAKVQYHCTACGSIQPKWNGQCPDCHEWNTLQETTPLPETKSQQARFSNYAGERTRIHKLKEIKIQEIPRVPTQMSELDRVLGGGLVPGSVILLGGDPGIGKSTVLLQTLCTLTNTDNLYVSGEESLQQIGLRAQRLNLPAEHLRLLTETCVETILALLQAEQPQLIVIDSIQTIFTQQLQSAPGSVSQIREATAQLVRFAKQTQTILFIVGHVTKEGTLAGPRVLEHMVDTVLYFEGDPGGRYRILRAVKNRFGAVNELGIFAMTEAGLKGVSNPSAIFLSRHDEPVPGSVIMVTREGTRPLLIELQALVDHSHAPPPKRIVIGIEQNRLTMLLAILNRHGGIPMFDQDVFINVVGGAKISETAADLPLLLAALSSFRDRPLPNDLVAFGEIGLAGEIRPVPNGEERLKEAYKHGFKRAIISKLNQPRQKIVQMEIIAVSRLEEAISELM